MGVPQERILSVTLISIKINILAEVISGDVHGSWYVDDFVICYKSKNMNSVEIQLEPLSSQNSKLGRWKTKSACVHFCTKRKPHNDPC